MIETTFNKDSNKKFVHSWLKKHATNARIKFILLLITDYFKHNYL